MNVDTTTNIVTFRHDEKINITMLEGLIRLYSLGTGGYTFVILPPEPVPALTVMGARVVRSDNKPGTRYTVVKLSNGKYVCSCPDYQHRRVENDTACKHIVWVIYNAPIAG
jgi:hypothetical protein